MNSAIEILLTKDIYTIPEAAKALRVSGAVVRKAIKTGQLAAFIIGGREPLRSGRGLGWRIKKADLQHWYFGEAGR